MKEIYTIQRTQALHHVQKLGGGGYDTDLTSKGTTQAKIIADNLFNKIGKEGVRIYCFDLKRTTEMAEIINKRFKGTIIKDSRIREICFGEAEGRGKAWQSNNIQFPQKEDFRMSHRVFKNAESRFELASRVKSFVIDLERLKDEQVIIITHGFTLTFIILNWLKVPIENMDYASFKSSPGGVTLLIEDYYYHNREVRYINNLEFITKSAEYMCLKEFTCGYTAPKSVDCGGYCD